VFSVMIYSAMSMFVRIDELRSSDSIYDCLYI
jgi:hypothetical protein